MAVDCFDERQHILNAMTNAERLRMLTTLSNGEMTVGNLAQLLASAGRRCRDNWRSSGPWI